ncbi:MAG: hypothetical protein ACFE95_12685 [Candidatus Hodarchaeota archaeon]
MTEIYTVLESSYSGDEVVWLAGSKISGAYESTTVKENLELKIALPTVSLQPIIH